MESDEDDTFQVPVMCACGGENVMECDILTDRYEIFCECGTSLEINAEEWWMQHANRRKDVDASI